MASSPSFSSSSIQEKYDVFISFRGTDTRHNFTSHVYAALCRKKIQTFIDNDLERGDVVSNALLKTILESKISVIIFSENYASSIWCLDELVKIMECNKENGQIVIPVFFKVNPSHVRHQSGPFGKALARFEGHPNIQTWRNVLTEAANLSGWDSQLIRPEAMLVESIVMDIMGRLYCTSSSSFGELVGMRSRFQRIESLLSAINEDVRIIGLWGMGGIGKTTLAREFFKHFFSRFEGHYFIGDIRETCEKRGLSELQEKLVIGLLKDGNLNVGTPNLGIPFIRDRLRRMKALIVFDDVWDFQHIKLLVGWRDCLGPESIVMITSRDKQVLENGLVDAIYDVPELDYDESLRLFSRHAFRREHPPEDHHTRRAVNYAKGHPLALMILGSHLYGKSAQYQESALRKLERTPDNYLQKVLRISYDGLDHQQKNLFLSIACLFNGENVNEVKCFHDACGYYTDIELDVLINKSLITIVWDRVLRMHDLLQEMGRQIVREESIEEPGKRSRLWDPNDICGVLTQNTGTVAVKGISWHMSEQGHDLSIHPAAFEKMRNLEFLQITDGLLLAVPLPNGLHYLPNKLRYLHWEGYPLTYLPSNFHPVNLVRLIMPGSNVERLWNGRQNLPHLKEIYLAYSKKLIEAPDLSLATNLQKLDLTVCSLVEKFPEISSLKIQYLKLGGTAIEEVPSTICNLKSLVEMKLYKLKPLDGSCMCFPLKKRGHQQREANIHLREFTDHRVWLSALECLDLSGNNFQEISVAINQLTNLRKLILTKCRRLQSLPQLPMNIKEIYAANCISLEMGATPLSIAAGGVFDCHAKAAHRILFMFANCCKLSQNARNSIVANVESRLLHWKNYPENTMNTSPEGQIMFPGGDVPDGFNYKSNRSSLTGNLPPHWRNAELLVFCVVVEFHQPIGWYRRRDSCNYNLHIRTNGGDFFCAEGSVGLGFDWNSTDAIPSNHVLFGFSKQLVNEWRKIPKGEDDAYEISIEFCVGEACKNYFTVKKCGVHLLYTDTHHIEDRCRLLSRL